MLMMGTIIVTSIIITTTTIIIIIMLLSWLSWLSLTITIMMMMCVCVRDVYDEDHDDAYTLCQASGVDLELSFS